MIASVRGEVLSVAASSVVVDVAGVGYLLQVTPQQALGLRIGQEARLLTTLIVREDDMSLYGFGTADELRTFDLLRGVSGVGPKSALGVLATLTPDQIAAAVAAEDDAPFRKVTGIGPKTAKLLVVSLQGKLLAPTGAPSAAPTATPRIADSVVTALVGLGWNERTAVAAVEEVGSDPQATSVAALLRLALASLGPGART